MCDGVPYVVYLLNRLEVTVLSWNYQMRWMNWINWMIWLNCKLDSLSLNSEIVRSSMVSVRLCSSLCVVEVAVEESVLV